MNLVFRYAVHGVASEEDIANKEEFDRVKKPETAMGIGITEAQLQALQNDKALSYIWAHEEAKKATSSKRIVELIASNNITRESIPTELQDIKVLKALLPGMPLGALMRNLGQMTSKDVLKAMTEETALVSDKLTNEEALAKARIHPMNVYMTWKMYVSGRGLKGDLCWSPIPKICDALEDAFHASFKHAEKINGNVLVGLDVSPSMWGSPCVGSPFMTAAEAAAVMSMVVMRQASDYEMMAFTGTLSPMQLTARMNFDAVNSELVRLCRTWNRDGTDCALPIKYAYDKGIDVDTFVILTDNQSWCGYGHPHEILRDYRKRYNKQAKLAVMAFQANDFTVADPNDSGTMDIAGLDSAVPKILQGFANGKI
jgi:60 kDa SS-A/Ro ribonucleoprotein